MIERTVTVKSVEWLDTKDGKKQYLSAVLTDGDWRAARSSKKRQRRDGSVREKTHIAIGDVSLPEETHANWDGAQPDFWSVSAGPGVGRM